MTSPLVSVVIPCYNASAYLADAIRSVREQTIPCEILVVDDCSKDNSLELARTLLKDHSPSLVVTSPRNQGPAAARNAGLRLAQGKYLCFLDADDQYTPEFASVAAQVLEDNPTHVAAYCEVEFINLHRPVEPWQKEVIETSLPSNLLVRTEVARQIGGYSTHPAFRGKVAGEDCAFRRQLPLYGEVAKIHAPLFKHLVRRGDHFDFFLDRVILKDGRIHATSWSKEQMDGSWAEANRLYEDAVMQRAVARATGSLETAVDDWITYHTLLRQLDGVEGSLHPFEGFLLFWLARGWPGAGQVVTIGGSRGRATGWLTAGCKEGKKGEVTAVESFRGDSWREPIRLLFLESDAACEQFPSWSRFVRPHGLAAFHGVGVAPGVTKRYNELGAQREQWRVLGQFHTLGVLARLGERGA